MPQSSGKKPILKLEVFEKPDGLRIDMFGNINKFPYDDGKEVADYISYLYETRNESKFSYENTEPEDSTNIA